MKKLLLTLLFVAITVSAEKIQNMPVALIPLDVDAEKLEALVLAQSSGIDFLERSEIAKLKKELKLSAASLTRDAFAIDFKKIKNVRLFCLLAADSIIIFDARSSLRLADFSLQGPLEQRAGKVISLLKLSKEKVDQIKRGKLLTLGFMPLTPVNLNSADAAEAKKIEQALCRAAAVPQNQAVLERRHLGLLLKEPGYESKQLNRKLHMSAVLVRPALTRKDGKLVLSAFFTLPGQKQAFKFSRISIDPKQDLLKQLVNFITVMPVTQADNSRKAEAGDFSAEARFFSEHLLHRAAVITAEDAVVLDKNQELLLGAIAARAAYRVWGNWGSAPPRVMGVTAKNFETAVRIAEKYRQYSFVLMLFVAKWGYVHRGTFESLPPDIQKSMRNTFARFARLAHELHLPLLKPPADRSVGARISALNNRAKYLDAMAYMLDQAWDYRYWKQYIIPELKIYIAELDDLIPELQKFFALPQHKRHVEYGISNINLDISNIGNFSNKRLSAGKDKDYAILVETCEILKQSRSLTLAQRGVNFLYRQETSKNELVADCLEIAGRCVYIGDNQTMGIFVDNYRSLSFEERLKLWDAYAVKLAIYNGVSLLAAPRKLSVARARQVQKIILEREKQLDADKRVSEENKRRYKKFFFAESLGRLERTHPELRRDNAFDTPFERVVEVAPGTRGHISIAVYKNGKIYYVILDGDKVSLMSVDMKDNFCVKTYPAFIDKRNGWYGWMGFTTATRKHIAFQNGPYVTLFGLDGSNPEILDFSEYYNKWSNGLAGYGDRLFISYGQWAGHQRPGTVLEYNLTTGKAKVIVSTLDRSLDWPLKGRSALFHVTAMELDPRRKCLMMLMPERLNGDHNSKPVRLWGYFWESGKWRRLSETVPIPDHNNQKIYLRDDDVYICGNGLWKIGSKGKVYKIFGRDCRALIVFDGLAFEGNAIRFIKENKLLRLRSWGRIDLVVDNKYVVLGGSHGSALRIGVLKSRKELLAAAQEIPATGNK